MDPLGYCWSHGYKVKLGHNSATCSSKKQGHQVNAMQANIMGGSTAYKNWVYRQCVIIPPNSNHNASNAESTNYCINHHEIHNICSSFPPTSNYYTILDSGASDHYFAQKPHGNKCSQTGYKPIAVKLPNGDSLTSTERCQLPIPNMENKATTGHVIPGLHKPLLSIGKMCDANYTAVFTNKDVKICKSSLQIPENDILLTGNRDETNGLYTTNLNSKHLANKVDHVHNATTKSTITFLYLAAFSLAISTLTNAIRKGFFKSWPGFTVGAVKKYVSNMPHVSAGRIDHI